MTPPSSLKSRRYSRERVHDVIAASIRSACLVTRRWGENLLEELGEAAIVPVADRISRKRERAIADGKRTTSCGNRLSEALLANEILCDRVNAAVRVGEARNRCPQHCFEMCVCLCELCAPYLNRL